jgi:hypothetical protein
MMGFGRASLILERRLEMGMHELRVGGLGSTLLNFVSGACVRRPLA